MNASIPSPEPNTNGVYHGAKVGDEKILALLNQRRESVTPPAPKSQLASLPPETLAKIDEGLRMIVRESDIQPPPTVEIVFTPNDSEAEDEEEDV